MHSLLCALPLSRTPTHVKLLHYMPFSGTESRAWIKCALSTKGFIIVPVLSTQSFCLVKCCLELQFNSPLFLGNGFIEGTELDGFLREFVSSANPTEVNAEVSYCLASSEAFILWRSVQDFSTYWITQWQGHRLGLGNFAHILTRASNLSSRSRAVSVRPAKWKSFAIQL